MGSASLTSNFWWGRVGNWSCWRYYGCQREKMPTMFDYIPRLGALPVPSAARGSARRRREEGGRRYGMMMRFTGPEYDALAALAADAGLSVPRYLVDSALAEEAQLQTASPAI